MTFEELLDQAIALLQRRGRLTYRALKRQLNVDDDYLEDLKAELIQGQRLAVDEDGAVLVWAGETDVAPRPTPALSGVGRPITSRAPSTPSLTICSACSRNVNRHWTVLATTALAPSPTGRGRGERGTWVLGQSPSP